MIEKKSRILYVKQYLEKQTDEEHPATVADILMYLETGDIPASRQTVTRDIEQLIEIGMDVVCNNGRPNEYFIGERHFELPELKLLVDAVRASRFIPSRKADALIEKLSGFTSRYQAGELHRSLYADTQSRPTDDKAYLIVDLLYTAINMNKKITCKYFDWDAEKKKTFKHSQEYHFSPYGFVWNNDRYYAVGWSDSHGKIITLRVDRIAAPVLTEEPAAPRPEGFGIAFYAESVIQMYDGPMRDVTLSCENDMMRHVIDRFSEDVKTEIIDTDHFAAYVCVPASPIFFAWVFAFDGGIRITAPEDVVNEYHKMANRAAGRQIILA